jgi:hypothetical protein
VFVGAAIYGSFFFFCAEILVEILTRFPKIRNGVLVMRLASALLAFLLFQRSAISRIDSEQACLQLAANQDAYRLILKAVKGIPHPWVLILQPGSVIPEVLSSWPLRDGEKTQYGSGSVISSEDAFRKRLSLADLAVTQDLEISVAHSRLPIEILLPLANWILEEDPLLCSRGKLEQIVEAQFMCMEGLGDSRLQIPTETPENWPKRLAEKI